MGHWDQFYRDRGVGRTGTTKTIHVGGGVSRERTGEVLFEARFRCPSCADMLVPGVRCEPCGAWPIDASSRLVLRADGDSLRARWRRWRHLRLAHMRRHQTPVIRGTIIAVVEDSTPSEPSRRVAAYVERSKQRFHSVCGTFIVKPEAHSSDEGAYRSQGNEELTVRGAALIAPSLGRGERRELVVGDSLILAGHLGGADFSGDVWMDS